MKVSGHWVRSPVRNVDSACQTCHRWSQEELLGRIHTIQDRTYEMRNIAIDATLQLAKAIGEAAGAGGQAEHLDLARLGLAAGHGQPLPETERTLRPRLHRPSSRQLPSAESGSSSAPIRTFSVPSADLAGGVKPGTPEAASRAEVA